MSKELSTVFPSTTVQKHQFFWLSLLYAPTLTFINDYWKSQSFDYMDQGKVMHPLFNMLSKLAIASLPRSKCLLVSWLQSLSSVILQPRKIKSVPVSTFSHSVCHEVMGLDAMILVLLMLSFKPAFSCPSFTLIKRLFGFSSLSAIRVVSSAYLRLLMFLTAISIPV